MESIWLTLLQEKLDPEMLKMLLEYRAKCIFWTAIVFIIITVSSTIIWIEYIKRNR